MCQVMLETGAEHRTRLIIYQKRVAHNLEQPAFVPV